MIFAEANWGMGVDTEIISVKYMVGRGDFVTKYIYRSGLEGLMVAIIIAFK